MAVRRHTAAAQKTEEMLVGGHHKTIGTFLSFPPSPRPPDFFLLYPSHGSNPWDVPMDDNKPSFTTQLGSTASASRSLISQIQVVDGRSGTTLPEEGVHCTRQWQ